MYWQERHDDRLQSQHQKLVRMRNHRKVQIVDAMHIHQRFARSVDRFIRNIGHIRAAYHNTITDYAERIYSNLQSIKDIKSSGTTCFPRKTFYKMEE